MQLLKPLALLSFLGPGLSAHAQIAFVKNNGLYVLPTDRSGCPSASKPAFLVTKLWKLVGEDSVCISWAPDGRIVVGHNVDAWNGNPRFGLPSDHPVSRLWTVQAKPHSRLRFLANGSDPSFSTDGIKVAFSWFSYDRNRFYYHVTVLDQRTGRRVNLEPGSDQPVWSPIKDALAVVNQSTGSVTLRSYPSLKALETLSDSGNPCELSFSPNGRFFALHNHLSRPLTGHVLFDIRSGKELTCFQPNQYAPILLEDWAPDSKSILCDWRLEDPKNDGNWLRDFVAIASLGPHSKARKLGEGDEAQFSTSGRAVLWLAGGRRSRRQGSDVVWLSLSSRKPRVLLRQVNGFSVFRRTGSVNVTIFGPGLQI